MYLTRRFTTHKAGSDKYVVCNGITGELLVINGAGLRLLDVLRQTDAGPCTTDMEKELERRRFLFASPEEEELAFVDACKRSWQDFRASVPRHYTFIVNSHCNFNCPYCFEHEEFRARASTMTPEQVDAAFRIIDRGVARRPGVATPDIEIFGGEPLLPGSRPILEYLMQRIAQRRFAASVQTNGYHLAAFTDFFVRFREQIKLVQVTLDGPKPVHDLRRVPKNREPSFDRIVGGIEALRREKLPIRISIRMNVDRENLEYLDEMSELYRAQGWTDDDLITFIAAPVDNRCGVIRDNSRLISWRELFEHVFPRSTDAGAGPFDLSVFKAVSYFRYYFDTVRRPDHEPPQFVPKALYCEAAALKLFAFHPDGRLYPCPETVGMEQLAIGTYFPRFTLDRRKARLWRQQTILSRRRCRECEVATFCGGGCVLTALIHNGSMASPVCEDAPEILDCYMTKVWQSSG